MRIGYARVSTEEQNKDAQLDALNIAYCEKLYIEKCSGKSENRPQLEQIN
ncbi:recombinase family protein [Pseudoalteromonas sp. SWXJZ10B]|nr:recombinase family protein [Pseudoalteromonas sp. SWXJZ10B]MBH0040851.1 recombinase family protein [Pseudoalteromonas sp. SWXJZ10B]